MKQDSADVLGDSLRNDSCSSALFLAKQRGSASGRNARTRVVVMGKCKRRVYASVRWQEGGAA